MTTTVQVPVSLGGTNVPYNDGTGAYGMKSQNGYGYKTYLFPMMSEVMAACAIAVSSGTSGAASAAAAEASAAAALTSQNAAAASATASAASAQTAQDLADAFGDLETAVNAAVTAAATATAAEEATDQNLEDIQTLAATLNNERRVDTWTALNAISGLATGTPGEVTNDPGTTHTDPVTSATVANEGIYSYVSATGWKRVGDRIADALIDAASALGDNVDASDEDTEVLVQSTDGETVLAVAIEDDKETLVGSAVDSLGIQPVEPWRFTALRLATAPTKYTAADGWNHLIFGGQSNALGSSDGDPVISSTQPYSNLTFDGGTRADGSTYSWSATKALIEEVQGATNSETSCSGATEFANNYAARKHGIAPSNFVQFASVAALGATGLAALDKPSATHTQLINQITQAKARATSASKSYNCQAVAWIHGETDASGSTTRSSYASLLATYISDLNTDILAVKSPTDPVHMLVAQCSYGANETATSNIALGQLDTIASNALCHLSHPTYFLPFDLDDTHRTVEGHKLEGAYFGRAYAQLILEGRKPDCLWPLGGFAYSTTLRIRFRVPTYPLRFDIATIQKVTNYGIKVTDGTGDLTLSNIHIEGGDTIVCTLNRALGSSPRLRLGIDYLPWNLGSGYSGITNGAATNIRDSTADSIVIAGTEYQMPHWCPHYEGAIHVLAS